MKQLILLLSLSLLVGCGSKEATSLNTSFVFTSGLSALESQTGGIILYGMNKDNSRDSFSLVIGSDSDKLELQNGRWQFMAVSWSGYNSKLETYGNTFEGDVRCSVIEEKVLDGGDIELSIVLNQAACSNTKFGLSDTKENNIPKRAKIQSCSNKDFINNDGDSDDCYRSVGKGVQAVLMLKDADGALTETMRSRCIANNSEAVSTGEINSSDEHDLNLPIFFPYDFYPIWSIEVFEDFDCDKRVSKSSFVHPYADEVVGDGGNFDSEELNVFKVYSPVCKTTIGDSNSPFYSYSGSALDIEDGYYILCTKNQLENFIAEGGSDELSATYRLGSDIDFASETISNSVINGSFSGVLNGDDHSISNFTLEVTSNNSGFFSETNGATITDIKLDSIVINCSSSGNQNIGGLAGVMVDTKISNISISNVAINSVGCVSVGGVAGKASNSTGSSLDQMQISNISVSDITINTSGNSSIIAGGIGEYKGIMTNSTFKNILISPVSGPTSTVNKYGGVLGFTQSGYVKNIIAENINLGSIDNSLLDVSQVGLFCGNLSSLQFLGNVEVSGSIYSDADSQYIGGVVGSASEISVISNLLSNVDINSFSTSTGGIFGSSSRNMNISGLRSGGSISCMSSCGGIAGRSLNNSYEAIYSNTSLSRNGEGNIGKVGGLIGESSGTDSILSGQNDGNVNFGTDSSMIGGIIGEYTGNEVFQYLLNHGDVSGGSAVGGIFGGFDGAPLNFYNFLNTGNISNESNDSSHFVGSFLDAYDDSVSNIIGLYSIESAADTSLFSTSSVYNLLGQADLASSLSNLDSFSPLFVEELQSNPIQLTGVNRLKQLDSIYKLGNNQSPFEINSVEKWNLIEDMNFFMESSFSLVSDLNFSNATFKSIGSEINPFKGEFIGNSFSLNNISIEASEVAELEGTISIAAGSSAVLGIGTLFESDLSVGDFVRIGGNTYRVLDISGNLNMSVNTAFDAAGSNLTIEKVPRSNIGIFSYTEDASINTSLTFGESYKGKLYINNLDITVPEAIGSSSVGGLIGFATGAININGIIIDEANISVVVNSSNDASVGGLVGNYSLVSEMGSYWNDIDIFNSTINVSGGDYNHAGGVVGKMTLSNSTEETSSSWYEFRSFRVLDSSVSGHQAGGIASDVIGGSYSALRFKNILVQSNSGDTVSASGSSAGGIFANATDVDLNQSVVRGIKISSVGESQNVGGLVGNSYGAMISGSYVTAEIVGNSGSVGCLVGQASSSSNTENSTSIENSYANCSNVSGTGSYFVGGLLSLNLTNENNVFYTGPSEEGSELGIYISRENLSNESFMTQNYPNFYSGDPWFWSEASQPPLSVMEVYPQYFFQ